MVTLHAIAQAGNAKVLSRPSILARNNQPATITVGQSVPLITGVRYDNFGNAINSITYQDVGVILRVTPFITGDGLVEMIVSPEISRLDPTTHDPHLPRREWRYDQRPGHRHPLGRHGRGHARRPDRRHRRPDANHQGGDRHQDPVAGRYPLAGEPLQADSRRARPRPS